MKLFFKFALFPLLVATFILIFFGKNVTALSLWNSATDLPLLLSNHYAFSASDRIYIIGGSNSSVPEVGIFAQIYPDGTLSQWSNITSNVPKRYWVNGVNFGEYIYILGGADQNWNSTNTVFVGQIENNGDILTWQSLNPLPKTITYGSSTILDNRIFYAGGNTDSKNNFWGSITDEIYMTTINPTNGTVGAWSMIGKLPHKTIAFRMLALNNYIYVFGGRNLTEIFNTVYRAPVDSETGLIGNWESLANIPKAIWAFGLEKNGDKIVLAGGHDGNNFLSDVYFSSIIGDGTLTNWESSTNILPKVSAGSPLVSWGDHLYYLGGQDNVNYSNKAFFTDIFTLTGGQIPSPSPTPTSSPSPPPILTSKVIVIPGMGASWNPEAFATCSFDPNPSHWTLAPYADSYYNQLSRSLSLAGWNTSFFYYDWRQQISINSNELASIIKSTTEEAEKINIIGHSMGGLVGVDYLEKQGEQKLDSLLTIGTPHKGTALSYPPWAGGDIWNDDLITKVGITLYLKHCGGLFSNNKDAIHNFVPSIQNLLPIYPYLISQKENIPHLPVNEINQNNHLTSFQNISDVRVGTIAGTGFETLEFINTRVPNKNNIIDSYWLDGKPAGKKHSYLGDGTVLVDSAILPNFDFNLILNRTHMGLINSFEGISGILNFLGTDSQVVYKDKEEPTSLLVVVGYPAIFTVTDQQGNLKSDDHGIISFENPNEGNYRINILPKGNETLFITAKFLRNGKVIYNEKKLRGYGPVIETLEF